MVARGAAERGISRTRTGTSLRVSPDTGHRTEGLPGRDVMEAGGATSSAFNVVGTVSAGIDHSCGVTSSGAAYCWGYNVYGGLGNGTTRNSTTPVAVSDGLTFAAKRAP